MQGWICPYYLTSARCPCTALTKYVPRVPDYPRHGSDGDNGSDDEDDGDVDGVWLQEDPLREPDRYNLFLIRADETERHAAYHEVDRLTVLLSLLAEDVDRELVNSAQLRQKKATDLYRQDADAQCRLQPSDTSFRGKTDASHCRVQVLLAQSIYGTGYSSFPRDFLESICITERNMR